MKWILGFLIIASCTTSLGCAMVAKDYTASTSATYSPTSGISYQSSKNQENFKAHAEFTSDGKLMKLDVETTASTPEAAIAAVANQNAVALKLAADALNAALKAASKAP